MQLGQNMEFSIDLPFSERDALFFELMKWQAIFLKAGLWITYTPRKYNPQLVFRKYAAENLKALPAALIKVAEAQERLNKAIDEALENAGKLRSMYLRQCRRLHTTKWHRRRWHKREW